MSDKLDEILEAGLLEVPDSFSQRLLQHIDQLPWPARVIYVSDILEWLALIGGGVLGLAQLASFMFGIWTVSAAG
ncbi:MAG TPA: hypothetical protein VFW00_03645 [Rhodocyclaceae bacterium]|nr:hypothetical protein [Rhodocyclaceae bacterium]